MLFSDNVNHADFTIRIITSRWGSDDFHIFYLSGRYLLQCLCTRIEARLSIDIYFEAATPSECYVTIDIDPYGRGVFKNIDSRTAASHQVVGGIDDLFIQFIDDLPFRTFHYDFG